MVISIADSSTLRYLGTQRLDDIVHERTSHTFSACQHRLNLQQQLHERTQANMPSIRQIMQNGDYSQGQSFDGHLATGTALPSNTRAAIVGGP